MLFTTNIPLCIFEVFFRKYAWSDLKHRFSYTYFVFILLLFSCTAFFFSIHHDFILLAVITLSGLRQFKYYFFLPTTLYQASVSVTLIFLTNQSIYIPNNSRLCSSLVVQGEHLYLHQSSPEKWIRPLILIFSLVSQDTGRLGRTPLSSPKPACKDRNITKFKAPKQ